VNDPLSPFRSSRAYVRAPDDGDGSVEDHFTATVPVVRNLSALGAPIVAAGCTVSTLHAREAGVGSLFPAASVARTWKVWPPSDRPEYDFGLAQVANVAPSSEQSNEEPGSPPENVNCAVSDDVDPGGPPVIVVSGGTVSTVQARVAGVGSVLPAWSVALTANV
jgi:hypothetical protein